MPRIIYSTSDTISKLKKGLLASWYDRVADDSKVVWEAASFVDPCIVLIDPALYA